MKQKKAHRDEIRDEYVFDYSKAVRGKYFQRLMKEGANVILVPIDFEEASTKAIELATDLGHKLGSEVVLLHVVNLVVLRRK